jgi:hypothetical protein
MFPFWDSLTEHEEQISVDNVHCLGSVPVSYTAAVVVTPEASEGQAHQHEDREPQAEDGSSDHVVSDVLQCITSALQ